MSGRTLQLVRLALLAILATAALAAPANAADFGFNEVDGGAFDPLGNPDNQAGSHPHELRVEFSVNTKPNEVGEPPEPGDPPELPVEELREVVTTLSPGLVGDPTAVPVCPAAAFFDTQVGGQECPLESQVGVVALTIADLNSTPLNTGVYNLDPGLGSAARLGFVLAGVPVTLDASLNPIPPYNVVVHATNVSQILPLFVADFRVWGVPADESHDAERGGSSSAERVPFLSLPTSCNGPLQVGLGATSWLGSSDSASFQFHDGLGAPLPMAGCDALEFSPNLQARPTTALADSPSGFDFDLQTPQSADPDEKATAHLRDTTVTLPEGLVVNPSSANGLEGCSPAQVSLNGPLPAACPDASKVASVEVDTPLLDHPVEGAAYIATPFDNPFESLLALYIALNDPQTGTVVKLAGEVHADPVTGRLTTTVEGAPQVPFEHFKLHFKAGAHAALRTPATCGAYTTTSALTPWSAPDSGPAATPFDSWSIEHAPGGGCATSPAALPNSPAFDAGSINPIAKSYSAFVLHLRRADASQNFSALDVTMPQGLTGKLAGTAICADSALALAAAKDGVAEKASPSCPAASRVGAVTAGAGAGPSPYYASGIAYMAGPYKGAPLSLAIVTPATAGPFDLGTIVVRTALYLNPKTAQINAVSDPIPSILEGIPLDVRTIDVNLDRPDFTLNGTSCDPSEVAGRLTSTLGQIAALSSRFQLGECARLSFKPKMTLRLKGGTRRSDHPALTTAIATRAGDANIASVTVAFPPSEFLENAHIRTVCTRPDFAADRCPAAAVYGRAAVETPLLDYPLAGNAYLRPSENLLPDLVIDLRGPSNQPIRVEAAGRTDSIHGGIRETFDFIPDVPFARAVVELQGGRKGLLVNSQNICRRPYRATVKYTAHNGATYIDHPKLQPNCRHKRHHHERKRSTP